MQHLALRLTNAKQLAQNRDCGEWTMCSIRREISREDHAMNRPRERDFDRRDISRQHKLAGATMADREVLPVGWIPEPPIHN